MPCEIAKRRLDLIKVGEEEAVELKAVGIERVVYAFCKAVGIIVQ
ncbi:hypothetical protein [Pyrobaculum aerophilum]|uniref:Uncharacterized protein n=1 Tax=Pyrobaculum aerophilum (strain ATCC 51768 / DSM 7523 / JCM 9630 / CIP 104966 / NBRC 100827 / IM2) TaxID=178306 RepID=Q8ZUF5_PYRAE|nr:MULTISPECIES: hypothetical protein [Pyrobaculum]AAL64452.1 hypothetical protein PAE2809 [Pyrobaculum aerophilum str. IM2]MCX8135616.1 hypothetical protein [Pyrobaculum aerophilum]